MNDEANSRIFGPVIHSYSRAQAIGTTHMHRNRLKSMGIKSQSLLISVCIALVSGSAHAEKYCWPWQKPVHHSVAIARPYSPVHFHRVLISSPIAPSGWKCGTYEAPAAYLTVVTVDRAEPIETPIAVGTGLVTIVEYNQPEKSADRRISDAQTFRLPDYTYKPIMVVTPLASIPEPSTWLALLLGFGVVGILLRHASRHRPRAALD